MKKVFFFVLFCIIISSYTKLFSQEEVTIEWLRLDGTANFGNYGRVNAIVNDASGNIYIHGTITQNCDMDPGSGVQMLYPPTCGGYTHSAIIAKYTSAGQYVWAYSLGCTKAVAIDIDASGNIFVTGRTENTSDFDPGPGVTNLVNGIYFAKYNNDGAMQWAYRIPTSNGCCGWGMDIKVDHANNIMGTSII